MPSTTERRKNTMKSIFLPERLKKIREDRGLNKAEAARLLGLSKMGYLRYESADRMNCCCHTGTKKILLPHVPVTGLIGADTGDQPLSFES